VPKNPLTRSSIIENPEQVLRERGIAILLTDPSSRGQEELELLTYMFRNNKFFRESKEKYGQEVYTQLIK
jgi:hypothetical protein